MKVKIIDFEEAIIGFLKKAVDTMPTTGHKFIAGLMLASSAKKVEDALSSFADADGCIDTSAVRRAIDGGFSAAGDKVSFTIGDESIKWLVKPVTISVTKADVLNDITALETRYAHV